MYGCPRIRVIRYSLGDVTLWSQVPFLSQITSVSWVIPLLSSTCLRRGPPQDPTSKIPLELPTPRLINPSNYPDPFLLLQ